MDARLFRYLFENTSNAIVMTGCTWDKEVREQIRYAYSCEMSHNNWRIRHRQEDEKILCSANPVNLFIMGSFSIEDAQRLIYAIHHGGVHTVVLPYVTTIHRFVIMQTLVSRGIEDEEVIEFIREPYLYLKKSTVKKFFFLCGNGKTFEKTDAELYPGYYFEPQHKDVLDFIEEMEGYRVPVVKAGHIVDNRMLFYFGHFGADMRLVKQFVHHYAKSGRIQNYGKRELQKMLLIYLKEFGDPGMDSVTMFCSPIEILAMQTDCVLNTIVIDKEEFCHADIEADEGKCSVKCMLYNDYDVCHCHRTEAAELRAGILLLGNIRLAKYVKELRQHYKAVSQQIRAVSIPNCGNLHNWDRKLADMDAKKNAVFWICPLHVQMPDQILRDIKNRNARYRIIALNEEYGCCFNGFLTEKAE